jgi:hypothetical protein
MKVIRIKDLIKKQKNILFYNKDVNQCYEELKDIYLCVYFDEPVPVRLNLIGILKAINPDYKYNKGRITIAELREVIQKELGSKNLIILFNNFEKLTRSALTVYKHLNTNKNIKFICNFKNRFRHEAYTFFKTFNFINKEDYPHEENMKKINITYTIYAILSLICLLIYIKTSISFYFVTIIIGGIWFGLIIFRTLMYAGGRI